MDSNKSLYCPSLSEIVDSLKESPVSPTLVGFPPLFRALGSIVAASIFLFLILLIVIPWFQTVQGSGRVIAYSPNERVQKINATTDGRIERWHVQEGQSVKKGDLLLEIGDLDPQIMERLERELEAARIKLDAAERSVLTSEKNLERQKTLVEQGLSSQRAYELAQLEYAKFVSDTSSVAGELARLDTRISRQSSQAIVAPIDGMIQRILISQGGLLVKQGAELAVLVPETSNRAVELYVRGMDIPLITLGREVRVQFEGWPAIQFSGWPSVAKGTFGGVVAVIDPSDDGHGNFRIVVLPKADEPWPDGKYLRQGVRAVGWVLLDSVKLGWELWRQFNGFPPALKSVTEYHPAQNLPRGDEGKK